MKLTYSPAQAKINQYRETRQTYARMQELYTDMRERTTRMKAWVCYERQIQIEAELQKAEAALARFEWQHGIFDFS